MSDELCSSMTSEQRITCRLYANRILGPHSLVRLDECCETHLVQPLTVEYAGSGMLAGRITGISHVKANHTCFALRACCSRR